MKFKCNRNSILEEISIAQDILSTRNTLSILSNVLLEADSGTLTIKATDNKMGFEAKVPVDVISPGSTTVYCEKLLSILRSLSDEEILFSLEDSRMRISPEIEKADFQLKVIVAEQYPEFNEIDQDHYFEFSQNDFTEMISHTIFSVSNDQTRYFMNGVYLEKNENFLIMTATDGRRLAFIKKEVTGEVKDFSGVIIPIKVLFLIRKLSSGEGNLSLAISEDNIFFKIGNKRIYSGLIEGRFPDYEKVIPESQKYKILVNREKFFKALTRVSLLVEDKSRRIYLLFSEDMISFRSEETEMGAAKEEVSCSYKGPEVEVSMNCVYISDPLRVISSEEISILFTNSKDVITILSNPEGDYFHIVMPMRFS